MAETKKIDINKLTDDQRTLYRDYSEDVEAHDNAIKDFDAYEAMSNSRTYDAVSRETKNELTDSMTSTIYLERAARVAGQLPEGEMQATGNKDYGKGLFMDLLRTKWMYPNANAQHPFKTKMFIWQYGSSEYGAMPMYYDLNVSPSGYFGPDCWVWNPRNFIPQNGFTSVSDMDYAHALAYKSAGWFDDMVDEEDWLGDKIKKLLPQIKQKTRMTDPKRDTTKLRNQTSGSIRQVCVATRYEAGDGGHWITFLPEFGFEIIRDVPNPHKNGKIPFVIKPCIPTFDSYYGVGDFQRSMPMQFANDGLDTFYFQGIKLNLFAPIIANIQGVVPHTIKPGQPGTVWEETEKDSIRRLDTSSAGLSTYNSAKGMSKGAIQSIAGTTDTRSNADSASDPGFGKTPEAIKKISEREGTRDGQDRDNLEMAMQELIDGMLSLIPLIATKIPIDLFTDEIKEIGESYPDLADIFKRTRETGLTKWRVSQSGKQMRIMLDPSKLGGLEYRFQLEPNSTAKQTKQQQLDAMETFFDFLGKVPNALQEYRQYANKVVNWDWIFQQYGKLAGIKGFKNAFIDVPPQPAQAAQPATDPNAPADPNAVDPNAAGAPAQPADIAAAHAALGGDPSQPPAPQGEQVGQHTFTDPQLAAHAKDLMSMMQGA